MRTEEKVDRRESKKSPFFYKFLSKIKEPRTSNLLRTLHWKTRPWLNIVAFPSFIWGVGARGRRRLRSERVNERKGERNMRLVKECTHIFPHLCKRALVRWWTSWSLFIPNLLGGEPFPLENLGDGVEKYIVQNDGRCMWRKGVKENRPIDVGGERSSAKKVKLRAPAFLTLFVFMSIGPKNKEVLIRDKRK